MYTKKSTITGRNLINGEWKSNELQTFNVTNPATGEIVGTAPNASEDHVTDAIEAAHTAFGTWSKKTAYERGAILEIYYNLILANKETLGEIITLEMGKPLSEAIGEVEYAASYIKWYAEQGKRIYGEIIPPHFENKRMQVWKRPVGVVVAITPWNFPAAMLTRKIGPALAAGCSVIIKPSSETPLTAIKLVELAEEAGFPAGVVNLVTGSSSMISNIVFNHKAVSKVTFTGSTEVGKKLMVQASNQLKKVSLELGGHAPIIILDDADIDNAVEGVLASKFRNAGQTCICGNRIYVQSGIYEEFIEKFSAQVMKLKLGNGLQKQTDIGPLINGSAFEKVDRQVKDALQKGSTLVCGGNGQEELGENFYQPTVLRDVNHSMLVMNEETFGPVAPIHPFNLDREAIDFANNSPFGLAAYVFTESVSRGTHVIENLDYGIVGWNDGSPSAAQAPFGGMKESGVGREGGHQGIEDYLENQYISIKV